MMKRNDGLRSRGAGHTWIRNNVLGLVAIFIAMSGSAVAAQVATKDGAGTAAKKKAKRGPAGPQGPAGAHGMQGAQGLQGGQGMQGDQGIQGPAGTAVAFAAVQVSGTLVPDVGGAASIPGANEGIVQGDISHTADTGIYCFTTSFAPRNAVASISNSGDFGGGGESFGLATVNVRPAGGLNGCPMSATARVRTVLFGSGAAYSQPALTDLPFFVWFE